MRNGVLAGTACAARAFRWPTVAPLTAVIYDRKVDGSRGESTRSLGRCQLWSITRSRVLHHCASGREIGAVDGAYLFIFSDALQTSLAREAGFARALSRSLARVFKCSGPRVGVRAQARASLGHSAGPLCGVWLAALRPRSTCAHGRPLSVQHGTGPRPWLRLSQVAGQSTVQSPTAWMSFPLPCSAASAPTSLPGTSTSTGSRPRACRSSSAAAAAGPTRSARCCRWPPCGPRRGPPFFVLMAHAEGFLARNVF